MSDQVVHFRAYHRCAVCGHAGCYEFPGHPSLCPRHASQANLLDGGAPTLRGHTPDAENPLTEEEVDEQLESINERARELDEQEIDIGLLPEEQRDNQLVSIMADVGLAYAIRAGVFPEDELEASRQAATRFRSKAFESEAGPPPPRAPWWAAVAILVALGMTLGAILAAIWMIVG